MDSEHCFISYSNGDADEFGPRLAYELEGGTPFIDAWFDKRDIIPGQTWDAVVPEAIQKCKCLLFVMTKDSIAENSICIEELDLALSYNKPILLIQLQTDVKPPFRFRRRQWIDFSSNPKAGIAKLRQAIQRLDSPSGCLDTLEVELNDAQKRKIRAKGSEKIQINAEILELQEQIKKQTTPIKKSSQRNVKNSQWKRPKQTVTNKYRREKAEKARFHLDLINGTIARMNANSHQIKVWMVVIIVEILILSAIYQDNRFTLFGVLTTCIFWSLDAYYLWQERKLRGVFNDVINPDKALVKVGPFEIPIQNYTEGKYSFGDVFLSKWMLLLYFPVILLLLAIYFFM